MRTDHSSRASSIKCGLPFRAKEYDASIECYTLAISFSPRAAHLYANRAAAYLKVKQFEFAEKDCTSALECNSGFLKGWLRRAHARYELGKYQEAIEVQILQILSKY